MNRVVPAVVRELFVLRSLRRVQAADRLQCPGVDALPHSYHRRVAYLVCASASCRHAVPRGPVGGSCACRSVPIQRRHPEAEGAGGVPRAGLEESIFPGNLFVPEIL